MTNSAQRIPVTVLTGFLGAGKTTLLNRILSEQHGFRIAVIENEYGPEGIDNELLVQEDGEQIIEMNNGCLCCTVRGDLIRILTTLQEKRARGEISFDRVVIETTGLADPGPVLQTFFLDINVSRNYTIDGVITVVDAVHGSRTLDEQPEAQAQVGFADRLLMSKTDLVDANSVDTLTGRLKKINSRAPLRMVHFGDTPIHDLLAIGGFDASAALETQAQDNHEHHDHHHDGEDAYAHASHHTDSIAAFSYSSDRAFDPERLEQLFAALAEGYGPDLLRYKGFVSVAGIDHRIVVQGVQWVMGTDKGQSWVDGAPRTSKIVFIGRDIDKDNVIDSLNRCLVQD